MATPTIQIDQTPLVAGTPGSSREDLVLGTAVIGTDPVNGAGSYSWTLVVPPGSSATLSGGSTDTCSFVPDVRGTYLLYLVFDGTPSYTLDADLNKISTQGGAGVKYRQGTRALGTGETFQFAAVHGWAEDFIPYFETIDAVDEAKGASLGTVFYADVNGDLARLAPGSSGQHLRSNGAGAPSWATPVSNLQTAYAGGPAIVTGAGGAVAVSRTLADTVAALTVSKIPSSSIGGNAFSVTMGSNATGAAIGVTNNGAGPAFQWGTNKIKGGSLFLVEQGAAQVDVPTLGQLWTKASSELWFTGPNGIDIQLGVGGISTLVVANIDDPSTELNAIAGASQGDLRLCYQSSAGSDDWTMYAWDSADSVAEEVPYRVDGSSGMWSAVAGRYNHNGIDTPGEITAFAGSTKAIALGEMTLANTSTGLFSFDGLSIGTPTTDIDIGAGFGHILNSHTDPVNPTHTPVSWTATSLTITDRTDETITWIYIDSAGTAQQQTTEPTPVQIRENLFLGFLITISDAILEFQDNPYVAANPGAQLAELYDGIGTINLSVAISNGGSGLTLSNSGGTLVSRGSNFDGTAAGRANPNNVAIASANPQQFRYGTQTAFNPSFVTVINPLNYDVAGTITAIPGSNNQATNQRIWVAPDGSWAVQYGTTIYATISAAISGVASEAFVDHPTISVNKAVLVATLSVIKGATDLSNSTHARFLPGSKFGEASIGGSGQSVTSIQQAYNNSLDGTITTDATRTALKVINTLSDVTNTLELTKSPGASFAGDALEITLGANATGRGIHIINGGSGLALEVSSGHIQTGLGQRFIFDDDADTYAAAAGDDVLTFTAGGVDVLLYTASQLRVMVNGAEALPSMVPGRNDLDSGFWSPAANTVALSTGATEAWRVDPSQNMLLAANLSLGDTQRLNLDTDADSYIYAASDDDIWHVAGTVTAVKVQTAAVIYSVVPRPAVTDTTELGLSGSRWSTIYGTTIDILKNVVGVGETVGSLLVNSTDALSGSQEWAPMFVQQGEGWETVGASSQAVKFAQQVQTIQGSANPTGELVFKASIENVSAGAYADVAKLSSGGQWLMGNGAAATPSFAAAANPDLGIYFAANDIRMSINSAIRGVWSSAGLLIGLNGTAAAPALQIPNASGGVFSPGTGQLGIGVSGTEAVRWNASQQTLTVDGAAGTPAWSFASDPLSGFYLSATSVMRMAIAGSEVINFTSSSIQPGVTLRPSADNTLTLGSVSRHWQTVYGRTYRSRFNSVGTGESIGVEIQNVTAAADGVQQYSPLLVHEAQGWDDTVTQATSEVLFSTQAQPIQFATELPRAKMVWKSNINGAGYLHALTLSNQESTVGPTAWQLLAQPSDSGSGPWPAYSFINDPRTGMGLTTANTLVFSSASARRMTMSSSQVRMFYGASSTSPHISFENVDTGIGSPAADNVNIITAATEAVRFNASQQAIHADGSAALPSVTFDANELSGLYGEASLVGISVGGVAQMTLSTTSTSSANTFIPSTSDTYFLGSLTNRWGHLYVQRGITIGERAAAAWVHTAGTGQLWVKSSSPNVLMYQGDTDIDVQLLTGIAANTSGVFTNDVERQRWSANTTGLPVSTITRLGVLGEQPSDDLDVVGFALANTTAAADDLPENSPALIWQGEVYDGTVSQTARWSAQLINGVSGTGGEPLFYSTWALRAQSSVGWQDVLEATRSGTVNELKTYVDIMPSADSTLNLGSTGIRWSQVWTDAITITAAVNIGGDLNHDGSNVGFYSTAPIAQQTGVAVTAGGIHAALVNLGLITA